MPLKKLFRSAHSSAQSLPDISAGSNVQPESPDNHWTDIWGVLREAPDRGKWNDAHWRSRAVQRSLVEAGRHAGRSRVEYVAPNIGFHLLTRDFFITAINTQTKWLVLIIFAIYLALSFAWSVPYYLLLRYSPGCIYGAQTYVEMWTFSFITMMTIGYGNTGPQACWAASWVIAIQSISSVLVEAVTIGIIFARISHPKQRGRSIFISDSAVIARRDGVLKFMFRVADIRRTQVVDPKIKAFMYTWGEGRVTAEGERIPVRCEAIDTGYIDGMLILPLTIEHTIDEKSPLCGHTHDSLVALDAELVVTFEGTTEFGNPFMARRSYVPSDLAWGHQFVDIICRPVPGETHYTIDLDRFHDTRPQEGLPPLPPAPLSQLVVSRAKRTVPYPLLGDNTLALADSLVLYRGSAGELRLAARAADTYPNQALDVTARMYLYRWSDAEVVDPAQPPVSIVQLECGYVDGTDRLHLRLPVEVTHVIDASSPLAAWDGPDAGSALRADADAEVVVVLSGYLYSTSENALRQRTYVVSRHVRAGCVFADIVKHPALTKDRKPRVRWARFHDVVPQQGEFLEDGAEEESGAGAGPGSNSAFADAPAPSELASRLASDLPSLSAFASRQFGALDASNDYTVAPMDLQRYAAMIASGDGTLMRGLSLRGQGARHAPLPNFYALQAAMSAAAPLEAADAAADVAPGDISRPSTQLGVLPAVARYALDTTDAADSLPHPRALHPALPGADRFRAGAGTMAREDSSDEETAGAPRAGEADALAARLAALLPEEMQRYRASVLANDTLLPRPRRDVSRMGSLLGQLAAQHALREGGLTTRSAPSPFAPMATEVASVRRAYTLQPVPERAASGSESSLEEALDHVESPMSPMGPHVLPRPRPPDAAEDSGGASAWRHDSRASLTPSAASRTLPRADTPRGLDENDAPLSSASSLRRSQMVQGSGSGARAASPDAPGSSRGGLQRGSFSRELGRAAEASEASGSREMAPRAGSPEPGEGEADAGPIHLVTPAQLWRQSRALTNLFTQDAPEDGGREEAASPPPRHLPRPRSVASALERRGEGSRHAAREGEGEAEAEGER